VTDRQTDRRTKLRRLRRSTAIAAVARKKATWAHEKAEISSIILQLHPKSAPYTKLKPTVGTHDRYVKCGYNNSAPKK